MSNTRHIYEIATDIKNDWKKVSFAARPYLDAMLTLDKITDSYMYDSARSILTYFLCNATSWRGEVAKRIKAEIRQIMKF